MFRGLSQMARRNEPPHETAGAVSDDFKCVEAHARVVTVHGQVRGTLTDQRADQRDRQDKRIAERALCSCRSGATLSGATSDITILQSSIIHFTPQAARGRP
jgi:hypothetical protein